MKQEQLVSIQILPNAKDPLFEQRENGVTHTTYLEETIFYSFIQHGDIEMVKQTFEKYAALGIVIGRLSDNSMRQMQYWAVCCITLGIRYAIQGGLEEMQAFNLSDSYIMQIDKLETAGEIVEYVESVALELTGLVHKAAHGECPEKIRKCLNYIDKHLHETICLRDLASILNLSEDYLSKLFKKHTGKTVREYIRNKKLEAAKTMLRGEYDQKQIAYNLGFCSQTYFITCFKEAYGITPRQYADMNR